MHECIKYCHVFEHTRKMNWKTKLSFRRCHGVYTKETLSATHLIPSRQETTICFSVSPVCNRSVWDQCFYQGVWCVFVRALTRFFFLLNSMIRSSPACFTENSRVDSLVYQHSFCSDGRLQQHNHFISENYYYCHIVKGKLSLCSHLRSKCKSETRNSKGRRSQVQR
jgi:hypothetical protein